MILVQVAFFYFTLVRTALSEASSARLEELAPRKAKGEAFLKRLDREDDLVASADALRTAAALASVLALGLLLDALRPIPFLALTFAGSALLLLTVGSFARAFGRARAEGIVLSQIAVASFLDRVLFPLRVSVGALERFLFRAAGARLLPPEEKIEEDIMEVVTEGERDGAIEEDAREMIENVIEFRDLDVGLLMTPRTEMVSIEDTGTLNDALEMILESGHSRIPVFHEDRDHIAGILYERDLLSAVARDETSKTISELMREAYFVPENMRVRGLLRELRERTIHIAIVLDEYGGTAGVVTFADVVEEIVGEVPDEDNEKAGTEFRLLAERVAELDGRMRIDELNESMDLRLPENESFDTIAGLAASVAGHVPAPNERLRYRNISLTVLEADERSVRRLRLEVLEGSEDLS